jgi:hypothetical protein
MSEGAVIALALGVGFIGLALNELAAKRAFVRFEFVRRDQEPGLFWFAVAGKVALMNPIQTTPSNPPCPSARRVPIRGANIDSAA